MSNRGFSCALLIWLLVVASPCMAAEVRQAGSQTGTTRDCSRWFGARWDDRCLLDKLRDPNYFGIGEGAASDQQLLDYIKANREGIAALLLQIDYGRDIQRFVTNRDRILLTENERAFVVTLGKAGTITQMLGLVASVLNALQQTAAGTAASESLGVLRQILFGIQVYERAAQVSISQGMRTVLDTYFYYRQNSTREAAWREISTTQAFDRPLLQMSRVKQIPSEKLNEWFENAYVAYRLAASPGIRKVQGQALARLTRSARDVSALASQPAQSSAPGASRESSREAAAPTAPSGQGGEASFAFASSSGTALLTVMDTDHSTTLGDNALKRLDMALCGNQLLPVAYDAYQKAGPKDNGRHMSQNFDQREGYRFRILQGRAADDESCLIGNRNFFAGKEVLTVSVQRWPPKACASGIVSALSQLEGRGLVSCKEIGRLSTGEPVVVGEFQRRGNELLAAIGLNRSNGLVVYELPAKFEPESQTGWRVGDGGSLENSEFVPLFVLRRMPGDEVELGIAWFGEEGASLLLLRSSGKRLIKVLQGYRYMLPL
jgi:hypothetical protein